MIESFPGGAIERVVEQFVREELSQENAQIAGVVWGMLAAGGKRLRPRITMLAGQAVGQGASEDPMLASYMELIHLATLVHDDVVDAADVRRGRESTNHAHGTRFSVLAGDYLFSWVFKKVTQAYSAPVPMILAAMLSEICNGEVKQLRAAGNLELSTDAYFEIIGKKTAELFAACAEVGAIVGLQRSCPPLADIREAPAVRALRDYGEAFGMAFQIRDDLLDLTESEAVLGKPAGSDLREKKVTLPLIYALGMEGTRIRTLAETLFAFDDAGSLAAAPALEALVAGIRTKRVIARTVEAVSSFSERAVAALSPLSASPARDELTSLARTLDQFSC